MSQLSHHKHLEIQDCGGITIVHFTDKMILEEAIIQKIGEDLFSLVDELERKKILLNLGNVNCLSSGILGKFITLNKKLQGTDKKLVMCNMNDDVFEPFRFTKLYKLFNIAKDQETALQMF